VCPPAPRNFEETAKTQADITLADLHLKARKFLEKHGVSIGHRNNLFYKEGTEIKPLYDDLKATRMSEAQIPPSVDARKPVLRSRSSAILSETYA
jgi:hypothetical protein